jgi:anti-sigma-K factor RskA
VELNDIISSGLLELYVTGLTSPEETQQVEQWIKQYPEVKAEIAEIEKATEAFAQANAVLPSATVKDNVMAIIKNGSPAAKVVDIKTATTAKVASISSYWKWAAAASVALLIGSAVMNVVYYNKYTTANKGLKETEQLLAQEQQRSNDMKDDMDMVQNPNSMPVVLKEMDPALDTKAKIYWMQNTGDVMVDASHLPDAPAGQQYQFWAIVDGKPVSGGMIITNDKGKKFRMQKMQSFGKAEAFAISLEKEGGNPTPTKVVSMGKII